MIDTFTHIKISKCPVCNKKYKDLKGNTIFKTSENIDISVDTICKECFDENLKEQLDWLNKDKDCGI